MKTIDQNEQRERAEDVTPALAPAYEPPRITRKRSLERVTLGTGTVKPGGAAGGN